MPQEESVYTLLHNRNRRERILLLARIDFHKRYYESRLGVLWAFLNPLFRLLVYYLVFTTIFKNDIENYALYLFSGLLIWISFQEATKKGISTMASKRYLIENISFDKIDLFISGTLTILNGLLFNFLMYMLMSIITGIPITWHILWVIPVVLILAILMFGISLILSTIHIYFRDIEHLWDMVLLLWFWINPIFYAKAILFESLPVLIWINPLAGIIINMRQGLLYGEPPDFLLLGWTFLYALVILAVGMLVFRKYSHKILEKV
ncbi:MAG: ABC transporter permease [Bacteroidales bacterium]